MDKLRKEGDDRPKDVLTSREVAAMLRVHIYTVNDLTKRGLLQGFKVRRRWRIYRTSVVQFMTSLVG